MCPPPCDCLQEVKKAILEDLIRLGKEAGLKSFEQVSDCVINVSVVFMFSILLLTTK